MPIYNLMEDAATAEISRAQVWQWIRIPRGVLDDGRKVTVDLFNDLLAGELASLRVGQSESRYTPENLGRGAELFARLTTDDQLADFLTLPGYELLP